MADGLETENIQATLDRLKAGASGITDEEAARRIKEYGPNVINEKKVSPVVKFAMKFWAPVPWMLEITVILTYFFGKYLDMYIILFLLVFNAIVTKSFANRRRIMSKGVVTKKPTIKNESVRNIAT